MLDNTAEEEAARQAAEDASLADAEQAGLKKPEKRQRQATLRETLLQQQPVPPGHAGQRPMQGEDTPSSSGGPSPQ
jgi:hypothetical protein